MWGIVAAVAAVAASTAASQPTTFRHAGRLRLHCKHCGAPLRNGVTACEYCKSDDVWLVPPYDEVVYPQVYTQSQLLTEAHDRRQAADYGLYPKPAPPPRRQPYSSPSPAPAPYYAPSYYSPAPAPSYDPSAPSPAPSFDSGGGGSFGGGGASGEW